MIFNVYKIVLLKDEFNKKIIIEEINCLCYAKKKYNFDLENTHFYIKKKVIYGEDGDDVNYTLFIINDYKNLVGIDLEKSNIMQKPAKYLCSFENISLGKYNRLGLINHLNDFVGSPRDYKNPLFFNINKHPKKEKINKKEFSSCIKFSDHFFSYDLLGGFNPSGNSLLLIIPIGLITIPVFNIIVYILYKFYKFKHYNICRIDCIYSKNFDKIFIGFVKYTHTKYVKTFEYKMDDINRFILEKELNNSNTFKLKVLFKNNEKEQIYILNNQTQEDLEGFIYLLNERLIINSSIDFNENK